MRVTNGFRRAKSLHDALTNAGAQLVLVNGLVRGQNVPEGLLKPLRAAVGRNVDGAGPELPDAVRKGLQSHRQLARIVRAPSLAARELLTLPVSYCVERPPQRPLPVPFTVLFSRGRTACVCSTQEASFMRHVSEGRVGFVVREIEAAALAVDQGRAAGSDFDAWIDARRRRRAWRLTPEASGAACMPGYVEGAPARATWGDVFDALGLELESVELHGPKET